MALYAHYHLPVYAFLGLLLWPSGGLWDYASAFPTEERRQYPWTPTGTGWGAVGDCPHAFPGTPHASTNAATSWGKMASDWPFYQVTLSASSGLARLG